jgi:hypothetical protein
MDGHVIVVGYISYSISNSTNVLCLQGNKEVKNVRYAINIQTGGIHFGFQSIKKMMLCTSLASYKGVLP